MRKAFTIHTAHSLILRSQRSSVVAFKVWLNTDAQTRFPSRLFQSLSQWTVHLKVRLRIIICIKKNVHHIWWQELSSGGPPLLNEYRGNWVHTPYRVLNDLTIILPHTHILTNTTQHNWAEGHHSLARALNWGHAPLGESRSLLLHLDSSQF